VRIDATEIAPRAATLILNMGWMFLPEVISDAGRMDFLALHPQTGALAIVECKTTITSPMGVLNQIDRYHEAFGIETAQKWAFSWNPISQKFANTFAEFDVSYHHIDNNLERSRNKLKISQKYRFYETFYRFYPFHDVFPTRTESGRILHPFVKALEKQEVPRFTKPAPSPFDMSDDDGDE
jgi:hypothetical protein